MGPTLTAHEYSNLLTDTQRALLRAVTIQPMFDVHSRSFRRKFGPYRNGETPIVIGTGYGEPPTRNRSKYLLPITPVEHTDLLTQAVTALMQQVDARILLVTGVDSDQTTQPVTTPDDFLSQLVAITGVH